MLAGRSQPRIAPPDRGAAVTLSLTLHGNPRNQSRHPQLTRWSVRRAVARTEQRCDAPGAIFSGYRRSSARVTICRGCSSAEFAGRGQDGRGGRYAGHPDKFRPEMAGARCFRYQHLGVHRRANSQGRGGCPGLARLPTPRQRRVCGTHMRSYNRPIQNQLNYPMQERRNPSCKENVRLQKAA